MWYYTLDFFSFTLNSFGIMFGAMLGIGLAILILEKIS